MLEGTIFTGELTIILVTALSGLFVGSDLYTYWYYTVSEGYS